MSRAFGDAGGFSAATVRGVTTSFEWHQGWPAPSGMAVRQVYAWVMDPAGRVLLLAMPGGWNLPGGTPERRDADWRETLARELVEEADLTACDVVPLGYQVVREDGGEPFVQLRVAARVAEWRNSTPDPDTGQVYRRVWVPIGAAAELLGWGAPGQAQAVAAAKVAVDVYGFTAAAATAQGASDASSRVMQLV